MTTTTIPAITPSGPRPPDSRLRWHLLACVAGMVFAGAILAATASISNSVIALGAAALSAFAWCLVASQSSLGYLVPGVLLGVSGLVHHHLWDIPALGQHLQATTNGVIVAASLGLAFALHQARRDGRAMVRHDEEVAAVHAAHAPESRMRRHVYSGIIAVILTAGAYLAAQYLAHPWNVLLSLALLAVTAGLGGISSIAPVAAGGGCAALALFQIFRGEDPRTLAVAAFILLAGALAARFARRSGGRYERRERAVTGS